MFETYNNFESHEHGFNTFFATSLASVFSLSIGSLLASSGFFDNSSSWVVFVALVLFPIIVFIAKSGESEFKPAYYKTWQDRLAGLFDRSKILKEFAKRYKIKTYKTKLDRLEVDGRWNFHADTNYMHRLTEQRDLLLSKLHEEYTSLASAQKNIIADAEYALKNIDVELNSAKAAELSSRELIKHAESSGEVYKQRRDHSTSIAVLNSSQKAQNEANLQIEKAKNELDKLYKNYKTTFYRIKIIFYTRYSKYTESAIKKINKINGLKYTIIDMPEAETWSNNLAGKEVK